MSYKQDLQGLPRRVRFVLEGGRISPAGCKFGALVDEVQSRIKSDRKAEAAIRYAEKHMSETEKAFDKMSKARRAKSAKGISKMKIAKTAQNARSDVRISKLVSALVCPW